MAVQKITLGEMRGAGVSGLLVYCSDYRCSHHLKISADPWPDEVRLSDLEPSFVCKACGRRGADIQRPPHQAGRLCFTRETSLKDLQDTLNADEDAPPCVD